jgi:formylglycine-generating enzyme required for sulfatase activity
LDHPNLCSVYDVGTQDDIPYLTMAYVEGRTLADVIKGGKLPPQAEAAGIVHKIALAMHEAHAQGIVHRDLKPANVMINRRGEPVVMDFGLARLSNQTNTRLTRLGAIMGTPSYMPPEQVRGDVAATGPGCDIYSLGVILYQLLTGHVPFEGPMDVVLGQILSQPPPPPSSYRPDLDALLEAVCLGAMQKEIASRHASMAKLAEALARWLRAPTSPVAAARPLQATMIEAPAPPVAVAGPLQPTLIEVSARSRESATVRHRSSGLGRQVPAKTDTSEPFADLRQENVPIGTRPHRGMGMAGIILAGVALLLAIVVVGGFVAFLIWSTRTANLGLAVVPAPKAVQPPNFGPLVKDGAIGAGAVFNPGLPGPKKDDETLGKKVDTNDVKQPGLVVDKNVKDKQGLAVAVEDELIREMKFVHVPKGTFWMGWDSEKKQSRQVTIAQDIELAAYTVTHGQWEAVMGNNPSMFSRQSVGKEWVKDISDAELKRFPVEQVSWDDAQIFLKKLNAREQGKGWRYRLPREAEWEYACRGGATSKEECSFDFYFAKGTNDLSWDQANFNGEFPGGNGAKGKFLGRTTQVGQYQPNKLGLYDMQGNVWQWCEDLYDDKGPGRVYRGGGWFSTGRYCRAAIRGRFTPSNRYYDLGFRVSRVPSGS